ncbi:DUF4147 domain-containing protein (plasmid) [Halorussus salilacus]|uniref:glycerate kinase type-2 family protein n=1 Tax=Halorussus salilacus TaxID=2953750 RepID=UPI00209CBC62|nr:DUF4147 domain-containing protein [Halorussus salilacus]USZ69797.1 DUF4147 domain-containing protein [Halorussus salilacus]
MTEDPSAGNDVRIRNRDALATTPARDLALDCVTAGIAAANPRRVVGEAVSVEDGVLRVADESHDLSAFSEVVVLGGGKAAGGVAAELEALLGDRLDRGVVVVDSPTECDRIDAVEGDHPIPTERGVAGARRVLDLADDADETTLVLAVVTGGASALLPAPAEGLGLADLRELTADLLESGATIDEINAVRKHCSALKGGRLAERVAPARVVGLVLSDVVGDDLGTVASGPLSPDPSTFEDALAVLDRRGTDPPEAVGERLERGARGELSETPTEGAAAFERVSMHVLASARTALDAAADVARDRGFAPLVLSSRVRGEAREAAKTHAAIAEEVRATGNPVESPAILLSGGETTVTVRGDGSGGPNLEFALSAGLELDAAGVALASVDTDGRDGGTEVAGGLVDSETVGGRTTGTVEGGISAASAREALAANDSLPALDAADCAIRTGPTGTNVNDLRVVVVEERE